MSFFFFFYLQWKLQNWLHFFLASALVESVVSSTSTLDGTEWQTCSWYEVELNGQLYLWEKAQRTQNVWTKFRLDAVNNKYFSHAGNGTTVSEP
jgi:hypothetical protein